MDDAAGRFLDVIHSLEEVRDAVTPVRAHADFDETTLQVFWKVARPFRWARLAVMRLSDELARADQPLP